MTKRQRERERKNVRDIERESALKENDKERER